ncbi:hypothetical protein CsatB_022959 [Cannabis sativa]|uniref:Uncharacterized protein n=1 Tax=Cannabis sativa TaxID=3483 RepID=A0A803PBG1_CANSA
MEGLLPMVYKSMKKNKTRRQYEHLSSGSAQSNYNDNISSDLSSTDRYNSKLRRHNSVAGLGRGATATSPPPSGARLVRFRSHRTFIFSCVGCAP